MAVEEAAESGDAAGLARWRDWVAAERERYIERLGGLFASVREVEGAGGVGGVGGASPPPENLAEIRRQLNAWRYIERMLEQIGA